jgi:hypothetical protein
MIMKKLNPLILGFIFFFAILIVIGNEISTSAQSLSHFENVVQPQPHILSVGAGHLWLTNTLAYTTYVPVVRLPTPAPITKKGVGAIASPTCNDLVKLKASWYLNWSINPDPSCGVRDLYKFVPRISNRQSMLSLTQAITNAKASGWLIGFSEPNLSWQSNISPLEGAQLWKQIEDAALPAGIKLVSPSPNQWEPGQGGQQYGHQWTWAMVTEYQKLYGKKPHFDAFGWNIYTESPVALQNFLLSRRAEALARGYTVPFWILEYGGQCWLGSDKNGNNAVITRGTPEFEITPWIQRYAWFANRLSGSEAYAPGWQSCSLITPSTGALTSLGQLYKNY